MHDTANHSTGSDLFVAQAAPYRRSSVCTWVAFHMGGSNYSGKPCREINSIVLTADRIVPKIKPHPSALRSGPAKMEAKNIENLYNLSRISCNIQHFAPEAQGSQSTVTLTLAEP